MNFCSQSNSKRDNLNTPKDGWEDILQYINTDTKLWLPFYNDGTAKTILEEMGYKNVIHLNKDFYSYDISDALVIDNPPFSHKQRIIKKLYDGRSFALLLPTDTLGRQYLKKYEKGFQLVIPHKRYNFMENSKYAVPFKSCWFCWNMEKYLKTTKRIIWL